MLMAVSVGTLEGATMERDEILEKIERCRRLASMMTDHEVRSSLQELADEYEAELRDGHESFMLRRAGRRA
jgi:hypothetical protein